MKPSHFLLLILVAVLGLGFGCSSDEKDAAIIPVDGDAEIINTPYLALSGPVAVKIGETIKVKAQTINATDASYTWTSANTGIATVTGSGAEVTVTGVAKGEVVLTASGADSKASGKWGVYVWAEPEKTSAVHVSGAVALEVGKTLTLTATTDGETETYTWTSSDTAKATVSAAGVVSGVAKGEVIITAKGATSGEEGTWGLYVFETPPIVPVVTISGAMRVYRDGTTQLTVATANGTDSAYTWISSNEKLATVDATGKVTGLAIGEVLITATGGTTKVAGTHGLVVIDSLMMQDALWKQSGHSDQASEAFNHWNTTDTKRIPIGCAKCHSEPGYADYLGADGSSEGSVEAPARIGTVIGCKTCHSAEAIAKTDVAFPSGKTVAGLGPSARCIVCHQGTAAGKTVSDALAAITPGLSRRRHRQHVHSFHQRPLSGRRGHGPGHQRGGRLRVRRQSLRPRLPA